jgi:hypothetical protein
MRSSYVGWESAGKLFNAIQVPPSQPALDGADDHPPTCTMHVSTMQGNIIYHTTLLLNQLAYSYFDEVFAAVGKIKGYRVSILVERYEEMIRLNDLKLFESCLPLILVD